MNKIVREHYPASKLPEDMRMSFSPHASVTITIVEEADPKALTKDEFIAMIRKSQEEKRGRGVTLDEAAARVRALRDEWDD